MHITQASHPVPPVGETPTTHAAHQAAQEFFHSQDATTDLLSALAEQNDPAARADLLWELGVQYAIQADACRTAFGACPIDSEPGHDHAEALETAAELVAAVAAAQHATATGTWRDPGHRAVIERLRHAISASSPSPPPRSPLGHRR
jgi:hypothetical protein